MRGIGLGRKTVVITTFSDCVYRARQEAQQERERLYGQHRSREAGVGLSILAASSQGCPGLSCYHSGLLLMRAAPDALCTKWDNFLLVWQVEVSRLLQGGQEFFSFSKIIIFVKEMKLRLKGCLRICSWEGLPYICQSSGLQFCPNVFDTTVKITPCVISYLVWQDLESTRQFTNSWFFFVLCRSGHTCIGDYLALITL